MYISRLKTVIVEALRRTLGDDLYPNRDFIDTKVGIEYPLSQQQYPSIWVNYDDRDSLVISSLDHREYILDDDGRQREVTRWTFSGTVTLTAVALSSLERDALFDELVRIYAFGRVEGNAGVRFRSILDENDFLALRVNWDEARPSGDAAAPGTPWGTDDEVIYEKSLSFDLEGDFTSDPSSNELLPLSGIQVDLDSVGPDGTSLSSDGFVVDEGLSPSFDPTQWH